MIPFSLSLAAILLAAPASAAQNSAADAKAEVAAIEKAADSAAGAADGANKAAGAAEKAALSAASAAQEAAKAAESAAKAVESMQKSAQAPAAPAVPAAPAAAPAPAAPAAPAPSPVTYSSVFNIGMIALTGNSQTLSFTLGGNFQRKSEDWIFGAKASASYGQTRDATSGSNVVNAEAATVALRGDRRFNPLASGYLLGGIDTDHIKSVEERPYGEIGASIIWFDVKEGDHSKTLLRTDLGFRYGREFRFQYLPAPLSLGTVDIVAPHLGVGYRYAVTKEIIFADDVDVVANLQGDARLLLTNTTKLSARLTNSLSFAVSFLLNYDSAPPPQKVSTDTALTIGIEVAL